AAEPGGAHPSHQGGQIDDAAATAALHQAGGILAAIDNAESIVAEGLLQLGLIDHAKQGLFQHTGIVDQHVQLTGLGKQLLKGLLDRLRLGHVETERLAGDTELGAEGGRQLAHGRFIAAPQPQLGSLRGELAGDGEANAAPGARDQYPLALQQPLHQRATPYLARISRALATELMSMMSSVSSRTP